MKKILLPFLLLLPALLASNIAKAQDQIVKQDKSIIKVTVLEITDDNVKYKLFDFPEGPIYNIKKAETFLIIYKNGRSESFAAPSPSQLAKPAVPAVAEPTKPAPSANVPMPAAPAAVVQPNVTSYTGGKAQKKDSRLIVGVGAYKRLYEIEGSEPGLVGKVGAEYFSKANQNGIVVMRNSGLGVAATYLSSIYVQVDNESVDYSKYYLSFYYFKEFDVKFISLGLLAGPGANYTTGTYKSASSSSGTDVNFFTGGLHTGQYVQTYLGKNAQQEKSLFLRLGFDQFIMLEGSISSILSLSIGF